jgi:sec-independent protein translocase protein TatB
MDVFGIGVLEIIFILIIAVIVLGPRDLAKIGRQVGRFLNRLYRSDGWRMLNDASRTLRNLPNRLAREAALEELDSVRDSIKESGQVLQGEIQKLDNSLEAWTPASTSPAKPSDQITAEETKKSIRKSEEGEA